MHVLHDSEKHFGVEMRNTRSSLHLPVIYARSDNFNQKARSPKTMKDEGTEHSLFMALPNRRCQWNIYFSI